MNWIQFFNSDKIEVVQGFTYIGPLKGKQKQNYWSNMAYHSIKVKVPLDFDIHIKGKSFRDVIWASKGKYYDASFNVESVMGLSKTKNYQILKITVEGLNTEIVSKVDNRDLLILDLLEDES